MKVWWGLAVAVVLLLCGIMHAQEEPPGAERIAELIKRLDSDLYERRQSATDELVRLGEPAIPALEAAAADRLQSIEVRRRAEQAAKKIKLAQIKRESIKLSELLAQADLAHRGKLDVGKLDALLDRLTFLAAEAGGLKRIEPVKAINLPQAAAGAEVFGRASLIVGDNIKLSSVSDSIVLARTSAQITSLRNSVVLAGVACEVSSVQNSVILAGHDLQSSSPRDSLLLCGGDIQASIARQSLLGAAGVVGLSIPEGCVLLNSRLARNENVIAGRAPTRVVEAEGIDLRLPECEEPLKGLVRLTTVVTLREGFALFRRREGDGEYVARLNKPLAFPDNRPMPELEGWQLVFCGRSYAVFANGDRQAVVRVEPGQ